MKRSWTRKRNQPMKSDQTVPGRLSDGSNLTIKIFGKRFHKRRYIVERFHKYIKPNLVISLFFLTVLCLWYSKTVLAKTCHLSQTDSSKLFLDIPHASLRVPYALDHEQSLRVRSANIEKWRRHHKWRREYNELGIDRRTNLSLEEFWEVYDGKWPVIITDVVKRWPAFNWTGDFLNQHYGQETVVMKAVDYHLDAAISRVFADLYQLSGDITDQTGLSGAVSVAVPLNRFYQNMDNAHPKSWTYVEDELFIPMRPELRKDIGDNVYLKEDFFQLFPEDVRPWNAMLLWGTKYSRSSLHMDPYNWTGTNAVIQGHKWWKLYPPGQDEYLYIMKDKRSGFPLDCYKYNSVVDAFDPDLKKYPLFKKAASVLIEQLPGEMLFIPSGWFHQAYNGEETLAISSQVMNRNNYRVVLEEILKVENIQREQLPADIDSMSPQQQVMTVMSMLPRKVLERGRTVTQDVLQKMKFRNRQQEKNFF